MHARRRRHLHSGWRHRICRWSLWVSGAGRGRPSACHLAWIPCGLRKMARVLTSLKAPRSNWIRQSSPVNVSGKSRHARWRRSAAWSEVLQINMGDIDDANAGQLIYLEYCVQCGPAELLPSPVMGGGGGAYAVVKTASWKVGDLGILVSKKKSRILAWKSLFQSGTILWNLNVSNVMILTALAINYINVSWQSKLGI